MGDFTAQKAGTGLLHCSAPEADAQLHSRYKNHQYVSRSIFPLVAVST